MKYAVLYDDASFTRSVNIAKWEIYLACLCDMATYAAAVVGRQTAAKPDDLESLAIHIVDRATESEELPVERPDGFEDIRKAYAERARSMRWGNIEPGEDIFVRSLSALVEWAPVADELKILDEEIVRNSMRFKWKNVRDRFRQALDADSVMADWQSNPGIAEARKGTD